MSATALHPVDLEPSLLTAHTYTTRRRSTVVDPATVMSMMVCLLYCLPAPLIVPELTYAGRPALLTAFALWCWWLTTRLNPRLVMVGPQPMRWVVFAYLVSILLSYLAGLARGLTTLEANGQDFTLIVTVQFLGVVLMAADGIPNWERLNGVLRVYLWSAGFMAVVGLLQASLKVNIVAYMTFPGLQLKSDVADFQPRGAGGLFRVAGTATHYIEFSTVMAMAVPFAIHFARFAPTRNARLAAGTVGVLVTAAIPFAISRTGVLALGIAMAVMFLAAWDWRTRYNVLIVGGAVVAALMVVKPGLLGTLKSMFATAENDPSITGRTDDYAYVAQWFSERPWLGRGPGTLIPDLYLILDSQWLYSLVTSGIVGAAAFAALHVTGITLASIALRRSTRPADRHLCAALISALVTSIVVSATFDSLGFSTFAFTLALMSGLCGAVWRFSHPRRTVRTSYVRRQSEYLQSD
ncbi:O-antigen ligase family protein [Micromonospora sp. NPDC005173]|uniref:O-antigen ligase family protein n=1 Tax=Micromonospora sp. NPDC005173 TaxID=3157165 RepID=UPI0033A23B0F